jgi:hypothetical protein
MAAVSYEALNQKRGKTTKSTIQCLYYIYDVLGKCVCVCVCVCCIINITCPYPSHKEICTQDSNICISFSAARLVKETYKSFASSSFLI